MKAAIVNPVRVSFVFALYIMTVVVARTKVVSMIQNSILYLQNVFHLDDLVQLCRSTSQSSLLDSSCVSGSIAT